MADHPGLGADRISRLVDILNSARKALVPLVVAGLAIVLERLGVDLPGDLLEQLAAGVITAVLVYFTKNK